MCCRLMGTSTASLRRDRVGRDTETTDMTGTEAEDAVWS